jgi:hypothetical protein
MNEKADLMDCSLFEEIVHDMERPGTQGFALRDIALAHAESCSDCARLMTEAESLDAALRDVATRDAGLQAHPRVETILRGEFRRKKNTLSRRKELRQIAALSVAAAVVLALGFLFNYRSSNNPGAPPSTNISAKALSSPVTSPDVAPAGSQQQVQPPESQADDSEYATAFVPLPFSDDHTEIDGGTVVRVVLSRPALASLGVPVTDPGATDQIPADLLLSEDGAPQAIRLISQASVAQ